ncbi:MAG: DnaA/Hda family protein [Pseudomonadota bacterium]
MPQGSIEQTDLSAFRQALIARFGKSVYMSWMSDIFIERDGDDEVALSTSSSMRCETLEQRFRPAIHEEWNKHVSHAKKLFIFVRKTERAQAAFSSENASNQNANLFLAAGGGGGSNVVSIEERSSDRSGADGGGKKPLRLADLASPLDFRSTFDTFAVDDSNRMAHAAALQVFVEGGAPGLIYLHGPSGVGKTHLLHAIGHQWRRKFGQGRCAYLTHSSLISGCVDAVLSSSTHYLHKDLLTQRLLLIDDIHLLKSSGRTQQEVLTLINAFSSTGRQLVVVGDEAPSVLAARGLNSRLADRLLGGLSVPIEQGGVSLCREILAMQATAGQMRCAIDAEALDFIAENFNRSTRHVIGALNQLGLVYGSKEVIVTRELAETALRSLLNVGRMIGTLSDTISAAAEAFGITVEDIKGRAQPQRIVKARHAVVFVARETLKESFPRIGEALNRDHTTAMSSHRRAQALLERNADFQSAVKRIQRAVGG